MLNEQNPTKQRLLITFGKSGTLKYTSNLDLAKIWERVLRRADLPLLYSQGFNTRPRIQLASALPLGITSSCELIDVALREGITLDGVRERLLAVSPSGLDIYTIETLDVQHPTLQNLVESAEYRIHFEDAPDLALLRERIDQLLARKSIIKETERKGRRHVTDLRPLIYGLEIDAGGDLIVQVAVGDHGNVRPDDVLTELALDHLHYSAHRQKLNLVKTR
ncbi:MAG: TIGR03936 family radical SAM-associated protein [Anaerolineae bacterium]|nr:TIGR03936 family radical SAM-associated protein [Anaerolineae bacterium]